MMTSMSRRLFFWDFRAPRLVLFLRLRLDGSGWGNHQMSHQAETAASAASFEVQVADDLSDAAKNWLRSQPRFRLAESLVAFVSETDVGLPRDQFLRLVVNRIVAELSAPLRA
jgi:hypothetical protein